MGPLGSPDVSVDVVEVDQSIAAVPHVIDDAHAVLTYAGELRVKVAGGDHVRVEVAPGLRRAALHLTLTGPVLGLVMTQRDHLVLHASAVALPSGRVAVLIGSSGAGKSSIAAAACAAGAHLVADDLVPIPTSGAPTTHAGYPMVKLFPEVARRLAAPAFEGDRLEGGKIAADLRDRFAAGAHRVTTVYVLTAGHAAIVEPLSPGRALTALVEGTYVHHLLRTAHGRAAHFQTLASLIDTVRVATLVTGDAGVEAAVEALLRDAG